MNKNTRYLIWGYYGFGNLGDDLMLGVIVRKIKCVHPDALIYVTCASVCQKEIIIPINFKKNLDKLWFISPAVYVCRLVVAVLKVDKIIIGGGTLFLDRGRPNLSMLSMCVAIFISKVFSKEVYLVGVGIDNLSLFINKIFLKYIIKNSGFVSVRDNFSFSVASNIVKRANIEKASDVVFDSKFVESLQKNKENGKNYIILALCEYDKLGKGREELHKFQVRSFELVESLLKKWGSKYKIVLCAFQNNKGDCDYQFLSGISGDIISKYPEFSERLLSKYIQREEQIKEYIGQAIFTISNRYHALVLSAILKVPFMGVRIEVKISEICNRFGMPFIEEGEYIKKGIGIDDLEVVETMKIDEQVLFKCIEEANGNFKWQGN